VITLDKLVTSEHCAECNATFRTVRGSVFADGEPIGLFLIALHGHSPQGKLAHLAIALKGETSSEMPIAAAMDVIAMPQQFGFSLVDWSASPWRAEAYLGRMLDREQVRASGQRTLFFQVADRVVEDLQEVQSYFD
jgi:hypothetical protein